MDYARRTQITQIVPGASRRGRWRELWSGSIVEKVQRLAAIESVDVHVIARSGLLGDSGIAGHASSKRDETSSPN
jgi:K+-sensing histidine kinase KdpD